MRSHMDRYWGIWPSGSDGCCYWGDKLYSRWEETTQFIVSTPRRYWQILSAWLPVWECRVRLEKQVIKLSITIRHTQLYWKYIIHFVLLNWKYIHNVFTILLPNFQSLFKVPYWHWYEKSFSLWHSGSPSLEGQSDGPLSPSDRYTSVIKSEAAYVIMRLTSRCLERKQPNRVGVSPLCDVVSSFLCHSHTYRRKR